MYNSEIAKIFYAIADMLSLDEEDRHFEVLAYRKAAQTIESMQSDIGDIYTKEGVKGLMELPGIGKTTASHIEEFIKTGKIKKYEDLKKKYPIDFGQLTKIQGLGPKKAYRLYKELGIKDIATLKMAIENHKIQNLEGFGKRSEEELSKGLLLFDSNKGRLLLGVGLPEAERIKKKLEDSGLIERSAISGSTRRMRETVGDLDILVTSNKPEKVMDFIGTMSEVASVISKGPTRTTVALKIGMNCDIRVVEPDSFGAALQYFTGNKDHNVKIRTMAIKHGYKLNEYGMFDKKGKNVVGIEEADIYKKLGMDCPEPEMREDRGEIELAMKHILPNLITIKDMKGDLHTHTNHSDGQDTLENMADATAKLGLEYIGITDHSKTETQAGGMNDPEFVKHLAGIDKFNGKQNKITVLKSSEIDILKDGSLDLENKTMDLMDYTIASVHRNLNMGKEEMTKRVIKAFDTGYVNIFAHPTDRLIGERDGIKLDLEKIFESAEKNNVVLEIDSYPNRLDINDEIILKAREYKLKFSIDTDSHKTSDLGFMRYGIGMAKRGWLEKQDIINTMSLEKLKSFFKK